MTIEKHLSQSPIKLLKFSGDLDVRAIKPMKRVFKEISREEAIGIVIDFSSVKNISSQGVGILLIVLKKMRAMNREIRLGGLSPEIACIMEMTGLDRLFKIYQNADLAIRSF